MVDQVHERAAQLERTALSWTRWLLALAANGALLIRAGSAVGWWAAALGIFVLVATIALWVGVRLAYRQRRGTPAATLVLSGWQARVIAGFALLVGLIDVVVVAVHP